MKTFKIICLGLVCACVIAGCSKSDWPGSDCAGDDPANKVLKAAPVTETVIPVGLPNGVDDTEALMAAFTAASAPGILNPVVQLHEGVYHLDFVEIREFYGTFRGMGKGKSVITTVEDLNVDALISQNLNTILIRFVGGDVNMNNMTIMTPPGALSTGSENKIDGLTGFSGHTYLYSSPNDGINAVIDNIEFIGHWENCNFGLKAEYGIRYGVSVEGGWLSSITQITVTNCSFRDFLKGGALIWHLKGGEINVGTHMNGNVFDNIKSEHTNYDVGYGALGIWCNINAKISVIGNTFYNPPGTWFGIDLWRASWHTYLKVVPQTKATVCIIEGNEFYMSGGSGGIKMNDRRKYYFPEEDYMLVQVKNNIFNMTDGAYSGIECNCTTGTVIRNNRFSGSGSYGISLTADPFPVAKSFNENGLILGNNFSGTNYSVATIYIVRRTRDWTIVGGGLRESVMILDNPDMPNSNILVTGMNVNTSETPLGQTIVDNLEEMREGDW